MAVGAVRGRWWVIGIWGLPPVGWMETSWV